MKIDIIRSNNYRMSVPERKEQIPLKLKESNVPLATDMLQQRVEPRRKSIQYPLACLLREGLVQSEAETWPRYWNITESGRSIAAGLMSKRPPLPAPKARISVSETLRAQIQQKADELSKRYLEFAILLERLSELEQDQDIAA